MKADWSKYPNFPKKDHDCSATGKNEMVHEHMLRLQAVRDEFAQPMPVSSGFRDRSHPVERSKSTTGEHPRGRATDVRVHGPDALRLVAIAVKHGFTRIGVNQKGPVSGRFIHLGDSPDMPPGIWSY